jgi:hypothetical protein
MSSELKKGSNGDVEKMFTFSGVTDMDSIHAPKAKQNDMAVATRKSLSLDVFTYCFSFSTYDLLSFLVF